MTFTLLSADICIDELIKAEGNYNLAAEKLGLQTAEFVASIAADQYSLDKLNRALSTLTLLQNFKLSRQTALIIGESLATMENKDLNKLFAQLTQTVVTLASLNQQASQINAFEQLMRELPPDARRALMVVRNQPPPKQIVTNNNMNFDDDVEETG